MNDKIFSKAFKDKFIELVADVRQKPSSARAWLALGDVLTVMHLDEEAIECLRWAITLNDMLREASATQSEVEEKLRNLPSNWWWSQEKAESICPIWLYDEQALEGLWARTRINDNPKSGRFAWQAYEAVRDRVTGKLLNNLNNPDVWLELGEFIKEWEPSKGGACSKIGLRLNPRHIPAQKKRGLPVPKCRICEKSLENWEGKVWCSAYDYHKGLISGLVVTCLSCVGSENVHYLWGLKDLYNNFFYVMNYVLEGIVLLEPPGKSWSREAIRDFMDLAAYYLHESPTSKEWLDSKRFNEKAFSLQQV